MGSNYNHHQASDYFQKAMKSYKLADVWRERHTNEKDYTWTKNKPKRHCARLDFFLCSRSLHTRVKCVQHCFGYGSDHSCVVMKMNSDEPKRGKSFWKFNTKHLINDKYVNGAKEVVDISSRKYQLNNPSLKWELTKTELSGYSMVYSIEESKRMKSKHNSMVRAIEFIEKLLNEKYDETIDKELCRMKGQFDYHQTQKLQTLIFMSKAKHYSEGQKNTKFFLSRAKSRNTKRTMYQVLNEQGVIITDPKEIFNEQARFYAKLYKGDGRNNFRVVNTSRKVITPDMKSMLDSPLTKEEMMAALKHFPPEKTPGVDGLPAELYVALFEEIADRLLEAYNFAYETQKLHISARRGVLTYIPKKRDLLLLRNWRPLNMLSIDYKVLSKIIDNRLKAVLPAIIDETQTGFMEGRNILVNVMKLMEIMSDADRRRVNAIILQIDFEKCFDFIKHSAIQESLRYFGIGEVFIRWTMLLFSDFELCTQNNGNISPWIKPTRGVHQGCCISSHLYNICGQVFAHMFHNNKEIRGVNVQNIMNLLLQFADDTSLTLDPDKENIKQVIKTLQVAENQLELKVNYNKTCVYRIGSLRNTNSKYYTQEELSWDDPPFEKVGIIMDADYTKMATENLQPLLEKARAQIRNWKKQNLTLIGKVLVINTMIESLFVYRFTCDFCDNKDSIVHTLYDCVNVSMMWTRDCPN